MRRYLHCRRIWKFVLLFYHIRSIPFLDMVFPGKELQTPPCFFFLFKVIKNTWMVSFVLFASFTHLIICDRYNSQLRSYASRKIAYYSLKHRVRCIYSLKKTITYRNMQILFQITLTRLRLLISIIYLNQLEDVWC